MAIIIIITAVNAIVTIVIIMDYIMLVIVIPTIVTIVQLSRVGDFAVALCRTPKLTIYIFSLPQCHLQVVVPKMQTNYQYLYEYQYRYFLN